MSKMAADTTIFTNAENRYHDVTAIINFPVSQFVSPLSRHAVMQLLIFFD